MDQTATGRTIFGGGSAQPLPVRRAVTLDAKTLDEYPGSYEVIAGVQMTITKQGDHLAFQLPRQAPVGTIRGRERQLFRTGGGRDSHV